MKKVIVCGFLFSVETGAFEKNRYVYVDGNKIESVESGLKTGYEVIDLSDSYVMPGLIDTHVHTNLSGGFGDINEFGHLEPGDFTLISLLNAQKDLLAGFTTLRDEGGMGFTDVAVKKAINAGEVWGPRMLVSGPAITATGGHGDTHFPTYVKCDYQLGVVCNSPSECVAAARDNFKHGADQIKIMSTGGVMSKGDDVGAPEFTFAEMKAVCDFAKGRGRITSAHAHAGDGIKIAVRAGITSIEHGTMADEEAHALMIENGTYLVPTLSAGYNIMQNGVASGLPQFMVDKTATVIDSHFRTFKEAYEKGIKIAFGTDCGTPFTCHGKQTSEFQLIVKAGVSASDAILMATKNAAELLKLDSVIGSVSPGKFADITATAHNPLEDISALTDISFVMKDGEVYKNIRF